MTSPEASNDIVCTLTTKEAAVQGLEWVDLQHQAHGVTRVDGGVRMALPAGLLGVVEDLAHRERSCCTFLDISIAIEGDVLALQITSDNGDALPVIEAIAGLQTP